jgi:hypothetical protein
MMPGGFESGRILSRESMPFGVNLSDMGIKSTAQVILPKLKVNFIKSLEKKKVGGFSEVASALLAQFDILSVLRHRLYFVQLCYYVSNNLAQNDAKDAKNMYSFSYQLPCGILYFMAVETNNQQVLLEFQDKFKGMIGVSSTPLFRAYPIKAAFLNESVLFHGGKKKGQGVLLHTLKKRLMGKEELLVKWSEFEDVWKSNDWELFAAKVIIPSVVQSQQFNLDTFQSMVCYLHDNLIPVQDY